MMKTSLHSRMRRMRIPRNTGRVKRRRTSASSIGGQPPAALLPLPE
jgi:hypothetical protein